MKRTGWGHLVVGHSSIYWLCLEKKRLACVKKGLCLHVANPCGHYAGASAFKHCRKLTIEVRRAEK